MSNCDHIYTEFKPSSECISCGLKLILAVREEPKKDKALVFICNEVNVDDNEDTTISDSGSEGSSGSDDEEQSDHDD